MTNKNRRMKRKLRNVLLVLLITFAFLGPEITQFIDIPTGSKKEDYWYDPRLSDYLYEDDVSQTSYPFNAMNESYIMCKIQNTVYTSFTFNNTQYNVSYGLNMIPIDFGSVNQSYTITISQSDADNDVFDWLCVQPLFIKSDFIEANLDTPTNIQFNAGGMVTLLIQPNFSYNWLYIEIDGIIINNIYSTNSYPEVDSLYFIAIQYDGEYIPYSLDLVPKQHTLKFKGNGTIDYKIISSSDWDKDFLDDVEEITNMNIDDRYDPLDPVVWGYFEKGDNWYFPYNYIDETALVNIYIPETYTGSRFLTMVLNHGDVSELVIDNDKYMHKDLTFSARDYSKVIFLGKYTSGFHSISYKFSSETYMDISFFIDGKEVFMLENDEYRDSDADGLKNDKERILGTLFLSPDSDRDNVIDGLDASPTEYLILGNKEICQFKVIHNSSRNTKFDISVMRPKNDYYTNETMIWRGLEVSILPILRLFGNSTITISDLEETWDKEVVMYDLTEGLGSEYGDGIPNSEDENGEFQFIFPKPTESSFCYSFEYKIGNVAKNDSIIDMRFDIVWAVLSHLPDATELIHYYNFDNNIIIQSITMSEYGNVSYILGSPDSMIENQILWNLVQNSHLGSFSDFNVSNDVVGNGNVDFYELEDHLNSVREFNEISIDQNGNINETEVSYFSMEYTIYDILTKAKYIDDWVEIPDTLHYSCEHDAFVSFYSISDITESDLMDVFSSTRKSETIVCYTKNWGNYSTVGTNFEERINIFDFPVYMKRIEGYDNGEILELSKMIGSSIPKDKFIYQIEDVNYDKIYFKNITIIEKKESGKGVPNLIFDDDTDELKMTIDNRIWDVEFSKTIFNEYSKSIAEILHNLIDHIRFWLFGDADFKNYRFSRLEKINDWLIIFNKDTVYSLEDIKYVFKEIAREMDLYAFEKYGLELNELARNLREGIINQIEDPNLADDFAFYKMISEDLDDMWMCAFRGSELDIKGVLSYSRQMEIIDDFIKVLVKYDALPITMRVRRENVLDYIRRLEIGDIDAMEWWKYAPEGGGFSIDWYYRRYCIVSDTDLYHRRLSEAWTHLYTQGERMYLYYKSRGLYGRAKIRFEMAGMDNLKQCIIGMGISFVLGTYIVVASAIDLIDAQNKYMKGELDVVKFQLRLAIGFAKMLLGMTCILMGITYYKVLLSPNIYGKTLKSSLRSLGLLCDAFAIVITFIECVIAISEIDFSTPPEVWGWELADILLFTILVGIIPEILANFNLLYAFAFGLLGFYICELVRVTRWSGYYPKPNIEILDGDDETFYKFSDTKFKRQGGLEVGDIVNFSLSIKNTGNVETYFRANFSAGGSSFSDYQGKWERYNGYQPNDEQMLNFSRTLSNPSSYMTIKIGMMIDAELYGEKESLFEDIQVFTTLFPILDTKISGFYDDLTEFNKPRQYDELIKTYNILVKTYDHKNIADTLDKLSNRIEYDFLNDTVGNIPSEWSNDFTCEDAFSTILRPNQDIWTNWVCHIASHYDAVNDDYTYPDPSGEYEDYAICGDRYHEFVWDRFGFTNPDAGLGAEGCKRVDIFMYGDIETIDENFEPESDPVPVYLSFDGGTSWTDAEYGQFEDNWGWHIATFDNLDIQTNFTDFQIKLQSPDVGYYTGIRIDIIYAKIYYNTSTSNCDGEIVSEHLGHTKPIELTTYGEIAINRIYNTLSPSRSSGTIEFWMCKDNYSSFEFKDFFIITQSGSFIQFDGESYGNSFTPIKLDVWNHFRIDFQVGLFDLYLNGRKIATSISNNLTSNLSGIDLRFFHNYDTEDLTKTNVSHGYINSIDYSWSSNYYHWRSFAFNYTLSNISKYKNLRNNMLINTSICTDFYENHVDFDSYSKKAYFNFQFILNGTENPTINITLFNLPEGFTFSATKFSQSLQDTIHFIITDTGTLEYPRVYYFEMNITLSNNDTTIYYEKIPFRILPIEDYEIVQDNSVIYDELYPEILFHDDLEEGSWGLKDVSERIITQELVLTDDAYVYSGDTDQNYGSEAYLEVTKDTNYNPYRYEYSFVGYDGNVDYLDMNHTGISYTKLKIYRNGQYMGYFWSSEKILFHESTGSFDENTITWENMPDIGDKLDEKLAMVSGWHSFITYSYDKTGYWVLKPLGLAFLDEKVGACYRSKEYTGTVYDPYLLVEFAKNYQGDGLIYMQTDSSETLKLRREYKTNMTFHKDEIFRVIVETDASNIQMKLYSGGSLQKTLTMLSGNPNQERQTVEIQLDSNVIFDEIEFTNPSTMEGKHFICYDIKIVNDYFRSNYTSTFDFLGDTVGQMPSDWTLATGSAKIIHEFEGHNNVFQIYDGGNGYTSVYDGINNMENGTVEFLLRKEADSLDNLLSGLIINFDCTGVGAETYELFFIRIDASNTGNYDYYNNSEWITFGTGFKVNEWTHIKINFDCSLSTFDIYADGYIIGSNIPFYEDASYLERIFFDTESTNKHGMFYIDAIGYSWDSNYIIGDNKYETDTSFDLDSDVQVSKGDIIYTEFKTNSMNSIDFTLKNNDVVSNVYNIMPSGFQNEFIQSSTIVVNESFSFDEIEIIEDDCRYFELHRVFIIDATANVGEQFNPVNITNNGNYPLFLEFSFSGIEIDGSSGQSESQTRSPDTCSSVDRDSKKYWSYPTYAETQNDMYASCYLTSGAPDFNDWLRADDFNFDIPSGVSITGIKVEIDKYSPVASTVKDSSLRLRTSSGQKGDDKADTSTYWPTSDTDTYISYGGSSDTWGETWTVSEINSEDFGVDFSAYFVSTYRYARVDHIKITVYYEQPATEETPYENQYITVSPETTEVVEFDLEVPDNSSSNLYSRRIDYLLCGSNEHNIYIDNLDIDGIYLSSPMNSTYDVYGDNGNCTLNLYFVPEETLDWIGYSLDGNENITITGTKRISFPETNGMHTIQVFGNNSAGTMFCSEVKNFTIDYPIDIYHPNKTESTVIHSLFGNCSVFTMNEQGIPPSDWKVVEDSGYIEVVQTMNGVSYPVEICEEGLVNDELSMTFDFIEEYKYGNITIPILRESTNEKDTVIITLSGASGNMIYTIEFDDLYNGSYSSKDLLASNIFKNNTWQEITIFFNVSEGCVFYLDGKKYVASGENCTPFSSAYPPAYIDSIEIEAKYDTSDPREYKFWIDDLVIDEIAKGFILNVGYGFTDLEYSFDGGVKKSFDNLELFSFPTAGEHSIIIYGRDKHGNDYRSENLTFTSIGTCTVYNLTDAYETPVQWTDYDFTSPNCGDPESTGDTESNDNDYAVVSYDIIVGGTSTETERPDSDIQVGGWTTSPLWSKIDESGSPDGTKIDGTYGDVCILSLTDFSIPGSNYVTQIKIGAYGWSTNEPETYLKYQWRINGGAWSSIEYGGWSSTSKSWKYETWTDLVDNFYDDEDMDNLEIRIEVDRYIPDNSHQYIDKLYVEVTYAPCTYDYDFTVTWDMDDPNFYSADILYYDYKTTVATSTYLKIWNWDTSQWYTINSKTSTDWQTGMFSIADPFIQDGTKNIKVRFEKEIASGSKAEIYIDQLTVRYSKNMGSKTL